jgi:hypothetical protein
MINWKKTTLGILGIAAIGSEKCRTRTLAPPRQEKQSSHLTFVDATLSTHEEKIDALNSRLENVEKRNPPVNDPEDPQKKLEKETSALLASSVSDLLPTDLQSLRGATGAVLSPSGETDSLTISDTESEATTEEIDPKPEPCTNDTKEEVPTPKAESWPAENAPGREEQV